ncbi:DUF4418 family protein [Adlercreutzia aquisgranensis]|uniref:DUF4418 family protein n=1 Tax=Adlercreutzia aquisgranensis TaxID=2941323 RepID=UPI00203A89AC|nr:DUF4418 family protein [Adlercreutzia aquisgranensis]
MGKNVTSAENVVAHRVLMVVAAVAAAVAVAASFSWALPCAGVLELANGNAVPMRCAWTQRAVVLLGAVLVCAAIGAAVTGKGGSWAVGLLAVAMIAVTFDTVAGIGVCKSEMACWTMAAWVRGCAAVALVAAAASAVAPLTRKQVR